MCSKFEDIYSSITNIFNFFSVIMPPSALDQLGRYYLRAWAKKNVFRVTGLKILGRVYRHTKIFLIIFFLEKNIILFIFNSISPFKMHKITFFQKI